MLIPHLPNPSHSYNASQRHFACVYLPLAHLLSQQSSKIDNNSKQKKKTKQNKSSAAAAAILNKNANNNSNKVCTTLKLSAPSLVLSLSQLGALWRSLYAFALSHGAKLVLGAGDGVRACES